MSTDRSRRLFLKQTGIGGAGGILAAFGSGIQNAVAAQSVASKPSDLRITRISTAFATRSQRRMFVKIETNQGITGYGEGTDAVVGGHYLASVLGPSSSERTRSTSIASSKTCGASMRTTSSRGPRVERS